jgi:hypothetical protein
MFYYYEFTKNFEFQFNIFIEIAKLELLEN